MVWAIRNGGDYAEAAATREIEESERHRRDYPNQYHRCARCKGLVYVGTYPPDDVASIVQEHEEMDCYPG